MVGCGSPLACKKTRAALEKSACAGAKELRLGNQVVRVALFSRPARSQTHPGTARAEAVNQAGYVFLMPERSQNRIAFKRGLINRAQVHAPVILAWVPFRS